MATIVGRQLAGCEGFRVESPRGLLGWVEETWLGAEDETVALAVRTIDGRDGLVLVEDVELVVRERELVAMRAQSRLLELDVPRVETSSTGGLSASWRATGEVLEPPDPPGAFARALLAIRPWRLAPPPAVGAERPLLLQLAILYAAITVIVGLVIGLAFLAARLAAG